MNYSNYWKELNTMADKGRGHKVRNKFIKLKTCAIMFVKYKGKRYKVKVSLEDIDKVISFGGWSLVKQHKNNNIYYVKNNNKKTTTRLHRFITNCPKGMVVDHINHNTLDNRRCNLRICTPLENSFNTNRISKTGLRNILYHQKGYRVSIYIDKVNYRKYFSNLMDAKEYLNELKQQKDYKK